jgi:glycosyltransferase involved in cell wall biosynthesis
VGLRAGRAIWITWERHRRTRELCRAFDIELFELTARGPRLLRHPILLLRTVACLASTRPDTVFVQSPSILLGLWGGILKRAFGYTYVADLHNEAVEPFNYSFAAYRKALDWIARLADLCLVTNDPLKSIVEQRGGRAFVLPDRVPAVDVETAAVPHPPTPYVVFICSYSPDEPYLEVLSAASRLGDGMTVYVTGNPQGVLRGVSIPANVHLTGYLPAAEYEALLRGADAVIDLTRMDNCLVCGAYEAVAVERPLVTSDTRALRTYFNRGTVYAAHTPESLAAAIEQAVAQKTRLAEEMRLLKLELGERWNEGADQLRRLLALS